MARAIDSEAQDALADMGLGKKSGKSRSSSSKKPITTITVTPSSSQSKDRPFSVTWMWVSIAIFLAFQVMVGAVIKGFVVSRPVTDFTGFLVEGGLNLVGFFVAGLIVGIISPGRRLFEPAVGAALSLFIALTIAWFSPGWFYQMSLDKLVPGSILAFVIALYGARAGEKLTGQL